MPLRSRQFAILLLLIAALLLFAYGWRQTHGRVLASTARVLTCGNSVCDATENCQTCPRDCGACGDFCGDGVCYGAETCQTCNKDCGVCAPSCGDSACNGAETSATCPQDCGQP